MAQTRVGMGCDVRFFVVFLCVFVVLCSYQKKSIVSHKKSIYQSIHMYVWSCVYNIEERTIHRCGASAFMQKIDQKT